MYICEVCLKIMIAWTVGMMMDDDLNDPMCQSGELFVVGAEEGPCHDVSDGSPSSSQHRHTNN